MIEKSSGKVAYYFWHTLSLVYIWSAIQQLGYSNVESKAHLRNASIKDIQDCTWPRIAFFNKEGQDSDFPIVLGDLKYPCWKLSSDDLRVILKVIILYLFSSFLIGVTEHLDGVNSFFRAGEYYLFILLVFANVRFMIHQNRRCIVRQGMPYSYILSGGVYHLWALYGLWFFYPRLLGRSSPLWEILDLNIF